MTINSYYNGLFTSRENIRIPLTDRAVFFGDGIYDAAIGRNGKIFMIDEHINRFFKNADAVDLRIDLSKDELKSVLLKLVGQSKYECCFIYFQLSRYSNERTHSYPANTKSNLLITVSQQAIPDVSKRLKLTLAKDVRYEMCHIKTLNLLPAVLASHKAEVIGKDETVFHRNGTVTECSHSNVHIISDSVLYTHPLDNHILPGISRKHMLEVAKRLGIKAVERKFSVYELLKADEVIVTSSSKLAALASSIDYIEFSPAVNGLGDRICNQMFLDFINFTKNNTMDC